MTTVNIAGDGREEDESLSENEDDLVFDYLGITEEDAHFNYLRAGTLVPECQSTIRIEDYRAHLVPGVEEQLELLLSELNMPYQLTEFQRTGACVLASGKSLFLVLPTGEGKLTVGLLAAHLLRRVRHQPCGVAIITQPLTRESYLSLINI